MFLTEFLLLLRFAAECYAADYIFVFTLTRRNKFAFRIVISIVTAVCAVAVMAAVCAAVPNTAVAEVVCFGIILVPLNLSWLCFCFSDSAWNTVFCAVFGLLTKLGVICIIEAIKAVIPNGSALMFFKEESVAGLICQYLLIAAAYVVTYFVFGRLYVRGESFTNCGKRIIPLYIFTAVIMPLLTVSGNAVNEIGVVYYVILKACQAAVCFFVISVQFSVGREMISNGQKNAVDALLRESQKQYDVLKESMDIINLKCHDIRHQIRAMESGKLDAGYLSELEQNISVYDSTINTGNDVLTVILTDKSLRCNANDIQFTCMADGRCLSFMSESDIISLFGNMLENAMEYESEYVDKEKRFISLLVKAEAGLVVIRAENYYCGGAVMRDGVPVTTKSDDMNHGFGIMSMKRITEKYGGEMSIKVHDELFTVTVVLPDNK